MTKTVKLTATQIKTLAKLQELIQAGPVDVTYAVRGVNRSSVDAMAAKGIVTLRWTAVENRNYKTCEVMSINL